MDSHKVQYLPLLYIITAVLLLTKGYFYAHLEHRNQPFKLFAWVLAGLCFWSFVMFLNLSIWNSFIIIGLAYCSYYLSYYLSNLQYWGSASLLFDVRQGKRLFGLLSSGESVAKILGYALTPLIVSKFNLQGVYLVIAISYAGAYLIFRKLSHSYRVSMSVNHHKHHHSTGVYENEGKVFTILSIRDIFKLDSFKRYVALFAFVSTLTIFLLQYAFLRRVEANFYNIEEIAVFFATIFTIAKFLNLAIKIFLAGRICQFWGLKIALLILPFSLLLTTIIGLLGLSTGQIEETFIMWIFAILIVLDEVLRSSLYTPAYLSLFQPLTKVERLEGHTLTKAIMEPLGILVSGIVIILLVTLDAFHLHSLTPVVLVLLMLWIFAGYELFGQYLNVLKSALKSKILSKGIFELSKNEYQLLRNEKLESKDPAERLYALQMLGDKIDKDTQSRYMVSLLESDNTFILVNAIQYCKKHNLRGLDDYILPLLGHHDLYVRKNAVFEYARINPMTCVDFYKQLFESADDQKRANIIAATIKYGGLYGAIEFGDKLMQFLNSAESKRRILAAKIIGDIANNDYYHPLVQLLNDDNIKVRAAAIRAAGKTRNLAIVNKILDQRHIKSLRPVIRHTLEKYGKKLTLQARKYLNSESVSDKIDLLKLFRGNQSKSVLEVVYDCLNDANMDVRFEAIAILYGSSFEAVSHQKQKFQSLASRLLDHLQFMISVLPGIHDEQLKSAVYNEIHNVQLKCLFRLYAFDYSRKQFNDIIVNWYSHRKENKILAIELMDNIMTGKEKLKLISLVESIHDIRNLNHADQSSSTDSEQRLIESVLDDGNQNFSSWLLANCLRYQSVNHIKTELSEEIIKSDIFIVDQERKRLLNLSK